MTTPTTLADWVTHARAQAEAWEAEEELWRTVVGRIGHRREEFVQGAADRVADWRALESIAVLLDSMVADRGQRETLYADQVAELHRLYGADLARVAAHLPTTDDGSTR